MGWRKEPKSRVDSNAWWCSRARLEGRGGQGQESGSGLEVGLLVPAWLCLHVVCSFPWVRAYPGLWVLFKLSLCPMPRDLGV